MNTHPHSYIGIDVSKVRLDLAVFGHDAVVSFDNDKRGHTQLLGQLRKLQAAPARIVVEASGGYELDLCDALHKAELPVSLVNAYRARQYARAIGHTAKTDAIDAKVLADFARVDQSALYSPPSPQMLELIELRRCRQNLVDALAGLRTQLKQARSKALQAMLGELIEAQRKLLRKLECQIKAALKAQPEAAAQAKRLQSIPGIGVWSALALLCEVPELGTLSNKEVAKLVGVAPLNNDSGKRQGKAKIWGGRARVRRLLYMAATSAIRPEGPLRELYTRLRAQGKPEKVARVAVMRKLAIYANVLERDGVNWDRQKFDKHA